MKRSAMTHRFDVGEELFGAFLVPWMNRKSFARALAIPLGLMATLTLCSYYLGGHVPQAFHWLLYVSYWIVFTLFAVTCHRLVLLDSATIGPNGFRAGHGARRASCLSLWPCG